MTKVSDALSAQFKLAAEDLSEHYSTRQIVRVLYGEANTSNVNNFYVKKRGNRGVTQVEVMMIQMLRNYHEHCGHLDHIQVSDTGELNWPKMSASKVK